MVDKGCMNNLKNPAPCSCRCGFGDDSCVFCILCLLDSIDDTKGISSSSMFTDKYPGVGCQQMSGRFVPNVDGDCVTSYPIIILKKTLIPSRIITVPVCRSAVIYSTGARPGQGLADLCHASKHAGVWAPLTSATPENMPEWWLH